MATTVADIRSYVLGGTPAANYAVGGAFGDIKTAYAKHTDALGDITYYAFSLEALKVIALDTNVSGSANTNIHLYNDANTIVDYFSKQSNGVLQHEVTLDSGSDVVEYLSFAIEPRTFTASISSTSTYLIKYYTKLDNLTEVASYEKFSSSMIFANRVNGILTVFTDSDFLRAATGQKFDASGDLVPIVDASGIVKYEKEGGAVEYYQKGPSDAPYFKQVNVSESTTPPTVTDLEGPVIWREYSTPDSIDIEEFATNSAYGVNDVLHSGGMSGIIESSVRVYLKEFAGGLKEDVSGDAVYHFVYDNGAYENAVNGAAVGAKIVDLRSVENHMSVGANTSERKNPSREHSELFTVHLSQVLKKSGDSNDLYYNYAGPATLSEKTFSMGQDGNYNVNDKLYFMNSRGADNDDLSAFTEAFKRVAYALLNTLDQSGDSTSAYKAYNHNGLKNAAVESEILSTGNSVAEAGDLDDETVWTKDSASLTLSKTTDGITTYLTFGGISRETFATTGTYDATNILIQRTVQSDIVKTDIISTKLGANAVNKTDDNNTTYAYGNIGLATAARSSDCHANVNLVTAAEYADDGEVTTYTKMEGKSVLSLEGTYYDYSALNTDQDGLTIRTFATDAAYNIGDILSQRDIESGEELDYYIKKYNGLVEDVSGVSNGVEDGQGSTVFGDNGKPGSLFYSYDNVGSYANFGEFMQTAFSDDMPVNMVVIRVAGNNEPTTSDIYSTSYYKRAPGAGGGAGGGSGTVVFTQYGLKAAAGYMSPGQTVKDLDGETIWTKTSIDHTLVRDIGDSLSEYLTFYQPADLSGAVAFFLSRETFATINSTYTKGDRLKQAIVKNDNDRDEIISTKLGDNAVNKSVSNESTEYTETADNDNTYAYADLGLATAARSADSNVTIKQVTADDYHQDGEEVIDYSRVSQYVLKRTVSGVVTYFEYNNMATLSLKKFANNDGATYNVGEVLKRMNTSTGAEIDSYTKKFAGLMTDASSSSGTIDDDNQEASSGNYYYAYADISGVINAPDADIEPGATIIETSRNNEPSTSDVANHIYIKVAVGLAQKGSSTVYHAYSQIGMYNFAILTGKTADTTTVTEASTGFHVDHSGSTTWRWHSQNILMTGSSAPLTYLTYTDGASTLTERVFATSTAYEIDGSGAVLKRRTLSAVDVDNAAVTVSHEEQIRKISHDLTKSADHEEFHAYSAIGRLNAAIDTGDLAANKIVLDRTDAANEVSFTYKQQYVLQKTGENKYFEYSDLSGDVTSGGATSLSSLATLTLRAMATDDETYPVSVETQLNQMRQNGAVNETFIKKYSNIMLEADGQYYAYTTASLATIANDENLPVVSDGSGSATEVWDISGANFPAAADTLYKKIEQYILRAGAGAGPYTYRSYSFEAGTGISLPEFACKDTSANDVTEFGTGDRLIDVSGDITYTRVAKSVLTKSDDVIDGSANVFYVYSFAGHVGAHLVLKEAATNASVVANGSILKTESEGNWTKEAHNIVSQPEVISSQTYMNYRTFGDVSGYLGDADFATTDSYAVGSALREVRDVDANSMRYLKVLKAVLYSYEGDIYRAYTKVNDASNNGMVNVAQAADLSENRLPSAEFLMRPQLNEIEVGAFIRDMSDDKYYQKTERYVLLATDLSGASASLSAKALADVEDVSGNYSASSPAHYYDYSVAGHFGTFTLEELATGSFAVGTLLTDMITEDGTFERMAADVILRSATKEYHSYSNEGTTWVAQSSEARNNDHHLMEKFTPADGAKTYMVSRQNVLIGVDISGADSSTGNTYNVPATTSFYAYSLLSDASGIQVLSFANDVSSPIDNHYAVDDILVERTDSSRSVVEHTRVAAALLKTSASAYQAYSQEALKTFAALDLTAGTKVTENAGLAGAWSNAPGGDQSGVEYEYVSLNVLKTGTQSTYYVYNISSDASGLTLNTFATDASNYPIGAWIESLVNRDIATKVDGAATAEGSIYDGPIYTKVLSAGVLRRQASSSAVADAELRTYDASGVVLGLRAAALAEVNDISDGTVLIPENDCPVAGRAVNMAATAATAHRYLRCSKGLLREFSSHDASGAYTANFLAFQNASGGASEAMPYAALKQAAKNIDAAAAATSGDRLVAAESKIYVTLDGALTAYNLETIDYTKDNATSFPDTLRVGNKANLEACDKITFADYVTPLRDVMINFCEFDASGAVGDLTSSKAGLFAGKSIQNYSVGASLPIASYKVVRRGLMSVGTVADGNLEYYTFSDKGLVAAAVAAERNADGKFSFVKGDGTVEEFRRVAKGLLVSNNRLSADASDNLVPTAAIMYFADYNNTKDDDKANMYYYLYSLATQRSVGVDLSGSSTTADSKTYSRDASGALQAPTNVSDNIIDYVESGTITTLYSIVNLVGANYGAEKYETMSYGSSPATLVRNAIRVTPIDASGIVVSESTYTGTDDSFYVAYDPSGMVMSSAAAQIALDDIAQAPLATVPIGAQIYLGDKYTINMGSSYEKRNVGLLSDPTGTSLTYSLEGLRAFAHLYDGASNRSANLEVGVAGSATDASGVFTEYKNYRYYWFEKGVVLTYALSDSPVLAASEFNSRPSAWAPPSGKKEQRFDIFYLDAASPRADEPDVHDFIERAVLADITDASGHADFLRGAFPVGTKFVLHNEDDTEAYSADKILYKVAPGLIAKKINGETETTPSDYEYYAFNDYALAFGSNDTFVAGELLRRMENSDINAPVTNDWSWQDTGLLMDVSGTDSGLKWRLYGAPNLVRGRQWFALESNLVDEMDYYTYESPDTTTLIHAYTNVLEGDIANHDLSGSPLQAVSVLKSDASGTDYERDPATNPDGYLTYGNAGLALLANSDDLSGTSLKSTTYNVLPIDIDIESNIADDLSGAYLKLQQGAMYTGTHMVLYNENKFEEIMDREDITDFATMDANNSYATLRNPARATLRPVPLERMFVPDASGNNQGSAKIFDASNVLHGSTTYLVEKVLERDLLGSYAGNSEYVWTTNLMTLVNEQQQPSITTRELEVTNKNGDKQTYRNRTWLRPTDIQG